MYVHHARERLDLPRPPSACSQTSVNSTLFISRRALSGITLMVSLKTDLRKRKRKIQVEVDVALGLMTLVGVVGAQAGRFQHAPMIVQHQRAFRRALERLMLLPDGVLERGNILADAASAPRDAHRLAADRT